MHGPDFVERLKSALEHPLPGIEAQYQLARNLRPIPQTIPESAIKAAVLALFSIRSESWHLSFIKRTSLYKSDSHSGQISFPGGRKEGDENLDETALRETHEEIGVPPDSVELLGSLTDLYIPVSNYHVQPYVGYLREEVTFFPQETEVDKILHIPVRHLQEKENLKYKSMRIRNGLTLRDVPYFDLGEDILWGATAMMTNELLTLIEKIEDR